MNTGFEWAFLQWPGSTFKKILSTISHYGNTNQYLSEKWFHLLRWLKTTGRIISVDKDVAMGTHKPVVRMWNRAAALEGTLAVAQRAKHRTAVCLSSFILCTQPRGLKTNMKIPKAASSWESTHRAICYWAKGVAAAGQNTANHRKEWVLLY